jgi:S-DNA-T family DNA segregation ATPase FtsK/SpoIIIE
MGIRRGATRVFLSVPSIRLKGGVMYTKLSRTADRIEAVLRERHAPATVVGGKVMPGFIEMLLRPAPGTKVNQVKALQADIALAVGNSNVRIAQSGTHLAIQIARESREPVRLSNLMNQLGDVPRYTAVLGLSEDGAPLLARLSAPDVGHLLIAGTTGSGKTSLAQCILLSLCDRHRPRELGLIVLDPKRRERERDSFSQSIEKHLLLPIARTREEVIAAMNKVVETMEKRTADAEPSPRIVVYADELADLCQMGGESLILALTRVAQRGREPGIHLLACTQKPSSKAIGSLLKANLPLRLVGRMMSAEDARMAAGISGSGAERLNGCGDFIAVTGTKTIRFQAALPV